MSSALRASIWTSSRRCSSRWSTSARRSAAIAPRGLRSEEHTSELQSRPHLVCRLLLEKKKLNEVMKDTVTNWEDGLSDVGTAEHRWTRVHAPRLANHTSEHQSHVNTISCHTLVKGTKQ